MSDLSEGVAYVKRLAEPIACVVEHGAASVGGVVECNGWAVHRALRIVYTVSVGITWGWRGEHACNAEQKEYRAQHRSTGEGDRWRR